MTGGDRGELALVLHTHMPYVEGFGTWPFGEEWLWEAMATCYLPLLELLEREQRITLSLTPVLCDQFEADGIGERFVSFLRDVRVETHRLDIAGCRDGGREDLAAELERAAEDYERAALRFEGIGRDLCAALGRHASWTSSVTHAVLPLLASDAGVRLQVDAGIDSHRARGHAWAGGFWLPECAYAPWLSPLLAEAGVRSTCIDVTDVFGAGDARHLAPLRTPDGLVLFPIDRSVMELVWSDGGYPSHAAYRDSHALSVHHHHPWANDRRTYDHHRALEQVRVDAVRFVEAAMSRIELASFALGAPALCVCPLDTELLGHWWYEGVSWLEAVVEEADARGLALTTLDAARERYVAGPAPDLPATSWGTRRDLSTWDGARVADIAFGARRAELEVVAAARAGRLAGPGAERVMRELLALQSSDWAFIVTRDLAGPYPLERVEGHARALGEALLSVDSAEARLRNLAPHATPAPLRAP
jgi:1,4-alpha-glucan branching enzyme